MLSAVIHGGLRIGVLLLILALLPLPFVPPSSAEFLVSRERTLQRKLREMIAAASTSDRNFLIYLEAVKRAHIAELERELELIRGDHDWWKREDAEWRIVHGNPSA